MSNIINQGKASDQGQGQQSYVPKIEDQNIIFYSLHPKDIVSKQFLETLSKNPLLDRQFIKICVYPNYQNIRIPKKILELNKVPVLVPAGFPEPILGEDALSWLNNNAMTAEKSNGLDYGAIEDNNFSQKFSSLNEEFKQSDYNQFFNNDYNLGFAQGQDNNINQAFSGIKDIDRISTYDDGHENKKGISDRMAQRMNQLKFERDREVPQSPQRVGGMDTDSGNSDNTITGLMNSPMGYNPRINTNMSGGAPPYNPNMPQMPQMPQYNPNVNMQRGGMMGTQQYNPGVNMHQQSGSAPLQYNPDRNAPIGGRTSVAPPQMNIPSNRGGNMPGMPMRPFADRTVGGSRHDGGKYPPPTNMPGGMMIGAQVGEPMPMGGGFGAPVNF